MCTKLSDQEKRLIFEAGQGKTDKEIAVLLTITLGTIRTYWERIRTKLQTINKTHSVAHEMRTVHRIDLEMKDARIAELEAQLDP